VRLNGGTIDGCRIAGVDRLLGLASQRHDIMPDDTDADIVKVVVGKIRDISLLFSQCVALVAAATCVKKLPTALGGVIDGVPAAGKKVLEGRRKRTLSWLGRRGGPERAGRVGWSAKDAKKAPPIFLNDCDLCHGRLQVGLTHLNRIDDRKRRLLFERLGTPVPEL